MEPLLPALIRQCLENTRSPDGKVGVLRILEIGAGTGSATKMMLKVLSEMNGKYSYTFTDISNAFFVKARETFKPYLNNMKFNVLNVEDDPKAQGLAPNQFDLVV
jgi:predicted O-methyltransferase YrrM